MTDFADRLDRAIERGTRIKQQSRQEQAAKELSAEQAREMHGDARLKLTEQIESVLKTLCDRFPGFEYEGVYSAEGWGGAIYRNDIALQRSAASRSKAGSNRDLYSRFQLHVTPIAEVPLLELVGKGTVRNRELFNRRHFERLPEIDLDSFQEMVVTWSLEYAEQYAANQS